MERMKPLGSLALEDYNLWIGSCGYGGLPYAPKTILRYVAIARDFLRFLNEHAVHHLDEATTAHLRLFLHGNGGTRKGFAPPTRILVQSALNLFWRWAMEHEYVLDHLIERFTAERLRDRRRHFGGRKAVRLPKVLSWEQQDALLVLPTKMGRSFSSIRDKALFSFMLATGVRTDEVVSVLLANVDLVRGRLMVVGKGNKERLVQYEAADCLAAMSEWLALRESCGVSERAAGCLFLTQLGSPMTVRGVYGQVSKYLKLLDGATALPAHGGHILRHTAISRWLALGKPIREVMENTGHAHLGTLEIYAHLLVLPSEFGSTTQRAFGHRQHPNPL